MTEKLMKEIDMITLHKALFASACLTASLSTSAMAQENITTVCSLGNNIRIIEVVYTGESSVPCEVQYTKEAGTQTLWSASHSEGYCENKAASFIEKQKNWGWACETASVDTSVTQ